MERPAVFNTGDKFVLKAPTDDEYNHLKGEIISLDDDDGTDQPKFHFPTPDRNWYVSFAEIEPHVDARDMVSTTVDEIKAKREVILNRVKEIQTETSCLKARLKEADSILAALSAIPSE
jgi:hypothetical protein